MRTRPASRLLIFSPQQNLLLFRFTHTSDALAGRSYWATPGGGVEEGETFAQAALRELREETGILRDDAGEERARNTFTMMLPNGETVMADEHFFIIQAENEETDISRWSQHEKQVIRDQRWWSLEAINRCTETLYPRELIVNIMTRLSHK